MIFRIWPVKQGPGGEPAQVAQIHHFRMQDVELFAQRFSSQHHRGHNGQCQAEQTTDFEGESPRTSWANGRSAVDFRFIGRLVAQLFSHGQEQRRLLFLSVTRCFGQRSDALNRRLPRLAPPRQAATHGRHHNRFYYSKAKAKRPTLYHVISSCEMLLLGT